MPRQAVKTVRIKYVGPAEAVVTGDGVAFPKGESVEVSPDRAESLLMQDFEACE